MGQHTKTNKLDVQKEHLKHIFVDMIVTNIDIMQFQMTTTTKKEEKQGLKKWIKLSEKAIEIIHSVDHYEILVSLYNSFVNKKELYFLTLVNSVVDKNTITKWDKSEKGFKEFLKKEQQAIAQSKQEAKENQDNIEFIRKAKEQGKKVEMLFKDGKLKPVIVEEKSN